MSVEKRMKKGIRVTKCSTGQYFRSFSSRVVRDSEAISLSAARVAGEIEAAQIQPRAALFKCDGEDVR